MVERTRVLDIEDNRLARLGLAARLDAQSDLKVVAAADGPDAGLLRALETKPQVVLVKRSCVAQPSGRPKCAGRERCRTDVEAGAGGDRSDR